MSYTTKHPGTCLPESAKQHVAQLQETVLWTSSKQIIQISDRTSRKCREGLSMTSHLSSAERPHKDILRVLHELPDRSRDVFLSLRERASEKTNIVTVDKETLEALCGADPNYRSRIFRPIYEANLLRRVPKTVLATPKGVTTFMVNPDNFMVYDPRNSTAEETALALWDSLK